MLLIYLHGRIQSGLYVSQPTLINLLDVEIDDLPLDVTSYEEEKVGCKIGPLTFEKKRSQVLDTNETSIIYKGKYT